MKKIAIISLAVNFFLILSLVGQVIINTNKNTKINELESKIEDNDIDKISSSGTTNEVLNSTKKESKNNSNSKTNTDTTTNDLKSRKEIEECINNFFNTMYNYTNDNYVDRFTKAKEYAKDDVITGMKGITDGAEIKAPTTKVESKVSNLKAYYATDNTIIVIADMSYKIENLNGNNFRQVMQVGVIKENDKYLIDKFEIINTGATK